MFVGKVYFVGSTYKVHCARRVSSGVTSCVALSARSCLTLLACASLLTSTLVSVCEGLPRVVFVVVCQCSEAVDPGRAVCHTLLPLAVV